MEYLKSFFMLIKTTYQEWKEDSAPMLAAALAYYTAFSIAPLIILVVAIAGVLIGQDMLQNQILQEIESSVGEDAALLVSNLIENTTKPSEGILSTVLGVGALLLGALGVFTHLQNALNHIWDVEKTQKSGGIKGFIKGKLLSFGMILIIGFLLLVSLILSTGLSLLDNWLADNLPAWDIVLRILSFGISFGITTLLFMFIYKFLPEIEVQWRDVWIGALMTALLFTIGRSILSLYLGNSATASAYGAAGALAIVLIWVYYSAQIILFGAEFTQVFARRFGSMNLSEIVATFDDKVSNLSAGNANPGATSEQ